MTADADLVLTNGRIYTGAGNPKWVESLSIKDGRFHGSSP